MNDFNPQKKDLINLESNLLTLRSDKNDLVKRKIDIQNSLSFNRTHYKGVHQESKKRRELDESERELKRTLNDIEDQIKKLNIEIEAKNKLKTECEFHIKHNRPMDADTQKMHQHLLQLKKKYTEFAKDRTRIASLRVMANEIITDIDGILKLS
jgi:hypothetical protein